MEHQAWLLLRHKYNHTNPRKQIYVDVVLVFLLLTLNTFHTFSSASIVDFDQLNDSWVIFWCFYINFEHNRHINLIGVF